MKKIYFLAFVLFGFYSQIVSSQERSTQAPEIQSFFLNPDLKGAGQNSVNLYSGDVSLPINLLSISGRGGLGASVNAFYSSNIQNQRDVWALEAPTSVLGLGWSMDYDRIVVDHKNTGTVHDDDFYLISGGSSNELVMVSSTEITTNNWVKIFKTKNYQFWKITYYKSDERWEVIKEDGTKYIYGGGKTTGSDDNFISNGNAIQWGVKWGNWIGSSMRTQGQQQHAIAWNLSSVKNIWGDTITYEYLAIEEEVGRYGEPDYEEPKRHTKASYLQKITTPEGKKVEFVYQEKFFGEFMDPHSELEEEYEVISMITGTTLIQSEGEFEDAEWEAKSKGGPLPYTYSWTYSITFINEHGPVTEPQVTTGAIFDYDDLDLDVIDFDDISSLKLILTTEDADGNVDNDELIVDFVHTESDDDGSGGGGGCGLDCDDKPTPIKTSVPGIIELPDGSFHIEPDAYQEKFESKYLSRVIVTNESDIQLYYLQLNYAMYGSQGEPDYKRLLSSITQKYPNGEELPNLQFNYYGAGEEHPVALKKITYPTGAEVVYTYTEKNLTRSNIYETVSVPTGYEKGRFFSGSDYVVFTWRNSLDKLHVRILHWVGEWVSHDIDIIENAGELINNVEPNFSVTLQDNFFAILVGANQETDDKEIYFYWKDDKGLSSWNSYNQTLDFEDSKGGITSGKEFIAVIDYEGGDIYRYTWNYTGWSSGYNYNFINNLNYNSSSNDYFIGGTGNYFVEDNEGAVGNDILTVYYLNELLEWNENESSTGFTSDVSGKTKYNSVYASNSNFALSLANTDEVVLSLTESYGVTDVTITSDYSYTSPIYAINNQSYVLDEYRGTRDSKFLRYDGVGWLSKTIDKYGTLTFSMGDDVYLNRSADQVADFFRFDPNTLIWEKEASNLSDYTDGFASPQIGIYNYSLGRKYYQRKLDGTSVYVQNLPVSTTGDVIVDESLKYGGNFIAYNVNTPNGSGQDFNGADVSITRNGNEIVDTFHLNYRIEDKISVGGIFYEPGPRVSGNFIIAGTTGETFQIVYVPDKPNNTFKDYPVTKVEVDNGYENNEVEFVYDVSKATIDPTGSLAQYNKVTTKAGNPSEGYTENYFFNGLDNDELTVDYSEDENYTNADDYLRKVQGLPYKTRVYGSSLISETMTYWNVTEVPIERVSDNVQIDLGYYVRQTRTENTTEGVDTYSETQYNPDNGQPDKTVSINYDIDGEIYTLTSDVAYAYEQYTELEDLNMIVYPLEQVSSIQEGSGSPIITSKSVSTWKEWQTDKWAPFKSYIWDGSGADSDFEYTGTVGDDWILSGEVVTRNEYGGVVTSRSADEISSSVIYGYDRTFPIATFGNAELSEVFYSGFDAGDPSIETLDDWNYSGSWLYGGENTNLIFTGPPATDSYFHSSTTLDQSNAVLEFDAKLSSSTSSDFLSFDFGLLSWFPTNNTSGYRLKIYQDGSVVLVDQANGTIATGVMPTSPTNWNHVRIITQTIENIEVYINGEIVLRGSPSFSYPVTNYYYGFSAKVSGHVEFDNLRIYPNDATVSSVEYDKVYRDVAKSTNTDGYTVTMLRDKNRIVKEVQNPSGLIISSSSTVLSRQTNGSWVFDPSTPNASYGARYPSANAIRNSGAEYGDVNSPKFWSTSGTGVVERSKGEGYSGLYGLKYTQTDGGSLIQQLPQNDFLWQGKSYFVRFWVMKNEIHFSASPLITVSLEKSGVTVTKQATMTINDTDWMLFEAELNTTGGEFSSWNYSSYTSKLVITTNTNNMPLVFDDMYLGEMSNSGESRPGFSVSFSNGSGQGIQSQVWNGTDYTVSHTEYDDLGRTSKNWWPYAYDTGGEYHSGFASNADDYSLTEYYADPFSRVKSQKPVGSSSEQIEYSYGSETVNSVVFPVSIVTDINGIVSKTVSDYTGSTIRSVAAVGETEEIQTEQVFDVNTRIATSRPPKYFENTDDVWNSTSLSDFLGRNIEVNTPDGGTSRLNYDELGRLRFSQSAQQAAREMVSFTSYDELGRPVISGEGQETFTALAPDQTEDFEQNELNYIAVTGYDKMPDDTTFPWSLFDSQMSSVTPENTLQAVVAEAYKTNSRSAAWLDLNETTVTGDEGVISSPGNIIIGDNYTIASGGTVSVESGSRIILEPGFTAVSGSSFEANITSGLGAGANSNNEDWQAIFYSYDGKGRLTTKWIFTQDRSELGTEINYTYNDAGQMIQQHAVIGGDQELYHFYSYNTLGQLENVYAGTDEDRPANPVVTYTYDGQSRLTNKDFYGADNANVSYSYNSKGQLNALNSDLANDFVQTLTYNTDGTIDEVVSNNPGIGTTAHNQLFSYEFMYDNLGRLTSADYSDQGNTSNSSFDVNNLSYDKHGNIESLDRYQEGGTKVDELDYVYATGKNQLATVNEALSTTSSIDWDAEDQSFTYDLDGSLTSSTKSGGGGFDRISYGSSLPINMKLDDGTETVYRYNSEGWRISKSLVNTSGAVISTEHYIMDGGTLLAVTDENGEVTHWNLYGNELLGRLGITEEQIINTYGVITAETEGSYTTGANDTKANADGPIGLQTSATSVEFDNDWFYFEAENSGMVSFTINPSTSSFNLFWEIEKADGTSVLSGTSTFGTISGGFSAVAGTDYYLSIEYYGPNTTYTVSLSGTSSMEASKYYVYDYLGSVRQVVDETNTIVENYDYYPFGSVLASRITYEQTKETFTGKELDEETGLYYFGARYYDAALGRWSVMDPAGQLATPYGYATNPVMYTDPNGAFFGIDDAIIAAATLVYGYTRYGLEEGDWGSKALVNGAKTAAFALLAYNTGGTAVPAGNFLLQYAANEVVNEMVPPMVVPLSDNFSVTLSPSFAMTPDGLAMGGNVGANYGSGNFAASAGFGVNNFGYKANGTVSYGGASYGQTYYGGGSENQRVGAFGYKSKNFSLMFQNDAFSGTGDKWRTNAVELQFGDFILGTTLNTNDPEGEALARGQEASEATIVATGDDKSKIWGNNVGGFKTWKDGKVYRTPLYVGYKMAHKVTRIGFSHPLIQDATQNFVHRWFDIGVFSGRQHFYTNYQSEATGPYLYSGYYNPYSLYFR